ncbi:pyruvate dehydrogenase E2 component (dihydrolipoamide acetyltransferase) [Halovenus aranensis]|uniref:Pyruvate dehydrogenase E2 component (Dihydrolipoamide acetyltransferase) n=1 Tax=Halovenus aranensis TaxID=890420 RepID=A0A1G8VQ89_9EURY|nr:2-oxo acid dehydrogenase subunit E2 [Halovenus aranensis]SDJ68278.1 pyruvate dehydrogenase E2 component (dihydrolipoamide acetyltransferase) [Halovenus aranensis]
MAFEFELPDVGEGIAEGEIVAWHVSPGDTVEEDQVMADVETDKAVVDLPAPVTGTLLDLHAEEGEMVPVGDVVATIDVDGDGEVTEETPSEDTATEEVAATETAADSEPDQDALEASTGDGRVFAPPNVRRLAREEGVDITTVEGTGPSGRITESDVRAAANGEEQTTTSAVTPRDDGDTATQSTSETTTATTQTTVETADRDQTLATPATRKIAEEEGIDLDTVPTDKTRDGKAFVEEEDIRAFLEAEEASAETSAGADTATTSAGVETATPTPQEVTTEPYRGVRRTIGQQMEESKYTAPHVTHHDTADVSELVETRDELKARAEAEGITMTYMPFVIKAIVAALKEYPMLNSELDEEAEEIQYKHYYNIGIAVATDAGLMVPVVKDADDKGMLQLSSEVNELASKARNREVSPDELQGSTFSITNFGAFGGEYATPIINYPETAILGLGEIKQRPVVEDGEVVAKHTLPLSLTIDHRVIDGAEAAQFCNTVMEYLENPTLLLLE